MNTLATEVTCFFLRSKHLDTRSTGYVVEKILRTYKRGPELLRGFVAVAEVSAEQANLMQQCGTSNNHTWPTTTSVRDRKWSHACWKELHNIKNEGFMIFAVRNANHPHAINGLEVQTSLFMPFYNPLISTCNCHMRPKLCSCELFGGLFFQFLC